MKHIAIETEQRPVAEWLPKGNGDDIICLTRKGRPQFVVVPWDDGDEEVLAIRQNEQLMAHIDQSVKRARRGPTKSLEEIKKHFALGDKKRRR